MRVVYTLDDLDEDNIPHKKKSDSAANPSSFEGQSSSPQSTPKSSGKKGTLLKRKRLPLDPASEPALPKSSDEKRVPRSDTSLTPTPSMLPVKNLNDVFMSRKPKAVIENGHLRSRHHVKDLLACRPWLLEWYGRVKSRRMMPWRTEYNPDLTPEERTQRAYKVLVSEIMLQQTQMYVRCVSIIRTIYHSLINVAYWPCRPRPLPRATVIPYYMKWLQSFPTLASLASSSIESVHSHWKGLGYYSRGVRLLSCAQKIVNDPHLNGRFPPTAERMEKELPGVGRYTAGAVASIVFNEQIPAVDGNVLRLFSRLLALHAPLKPGSPGSKEPIEMVWKAAATMVEGVQTAGDLNQALIELGSTVCKPLNPDCGACPLKEACEAYKLNQGVCGAPHPIPSRVLLCLILFLSIRRRRSLFQPTSKISVQFASHFPKPQWLLHISR